MILRIFLHSGFIDVGSESLHGNDVFSRDQSVFVRADIEQQVCAALTLLKRGDPSLASEIRSLIRHIFTAAGNTVSRA